LSIERLKSLREEYKAIRAELAKTYRAAADLPAGGDVSKLQQAESKSVEDANKLTVRINNYCQGKSE
jgi:hypothetical protein